MVRISVSMGFMRTAFLGYDLMRYLGSVGFCALCLIALMGNGKSCVASVQNETPACLSGCSCCGQYGFPVIKFAEYLRRQHAY